MKWCFCQYFEIGGGRVGAGHSVGTGHALSVQVVYWYPVGSGHALTLRHHSHPKSKSHGCGWALPQIHPIQYFSRVGLFETTIHRRSNASIHI